jgi:phage regulator Rha-like protein
VVKVNMSNLVFLEPNKIDAIPFTTSDVIAEYAGIDYRSVQRIIETHRARLEKFGIMRFEITVSGKAGTGFQNPLSATPYLIFYLL